MKYIPLIAVGGLLVVGSGLFLLKGKGSDAFNGSPSSSTQVSDQGLADPSAQQMPGAPNSKTSGGNLAAGESLSLDEQLLERMETMQERRPNMRFDPDEVAAAMQRESAWKPVKEKPTNLPLEPELLNDGRRFFKLDDLKIETLMPGDTLKVKLEEVNEEYNVVIDRTEKHDYDSISWYGHIETGDGQTYTVNFTRGGDLTVGGLNTPEGHFVIQAHGQTGWVATSATLFKIDPNQPDVIYPEDVLAQERAQANNASGTQENTNTEPESVATNEAHDHSH